MPLIDASVTATGHMSRRDDGRLGFTVIEIDALAETLPGSETALSRAAVAAEERLITQALDVPVHAGVQVNPLAAVPRPRLGRGRQPGSVPRAAASDFLTEQRRVARGGPEATKGGPHGRDAIAGNGHQLAHADVARIPANTSSSSTSPTSRRRSCRWRRWARA